MFTTITFTHPCPNCGAGIKEWQTKGLILDELSPIENLLNIYQLNERMDAEIYDVCENCSYWVELKVKKGKVSNIIDVHKLEHYARHKTD